MRPLGAKGLQMGTAFLTCMESGTNKVHKEVILNANEDRSFSGKWARGIKNKFILEMQKHETLLPNFPVQNTKCGQKLFSCIKKTPKPNGLRASKY
ncbi:nitronate monooxygenase [Bacillus sp. FJAT-49870]|uniref:Nitronate monooxygenase n=1 Tax=Lederbergia citri TaxID=2833580 RepID=A0A942YJA6_9BACI|nr:nitronate monooxygenase [Lederbergia citri]